MVITLTMQKPGFKGLKSSGSSAIPIKKAIARCTKWESASGNYGPQCVFSFDQAQILAMDAPWPSDKFDLTIKISDSLNSGWGLFGKSVADSFGISLEELELGHMIGQSFLVEREDDHLFFVAKDGTEARGVVWHVSLWKQGQQVQVTAPPNVASSMMPPFNIPNAPQSAEERALSLLNGKKMNEFFQVAIVDDIIRADQNLVNQVINGTWFAAKLASGKITLQADGTYKTA